MVHVRKTEDRMTREEQIAFMEGANDRDAERQARWKKLYVKIDKAPPEKEPTE